MNSLGLPVEYLWTSVVDALSVGISIHSTSGQIIWANKKICEIFSKPLSELTGSDCYQAFHSEDSPCPHEEVLAAGSGAGLENEVTIAGRLLSLSIQPLLDQEGRACGFMRMLSDITSERRAEEQVVKAERFATLGQMLSGIAHDVGTPLNVISGYSEYLLMRTSADAQGHKELSAILHQTRRIAAMFAEALTFAQVSQGRKDPIEIRALVKSALDLVGHSLRKANIKVELTCRIDPPLIYGEAPQLRQALFNLLLNAGHVVGAGGRLEVVIEEAGDKPGFLALAFWGTDGTGAPHDFSLSLRCLLGPHSEAGTVGIGLSLVQRILNEAGAIITSGQASERGIPLTVYLPVNAGSRV